jgi:molybdenum cofactor cytidylyltransferase
MVCDQPFVSASLINDLVDKKKSTGKSVIACTYKETIGTPALFGHTHFPELMQLQGQDGAKKILLQHAGALETISFPMGYIDIDTMQDYQDLGSLVRGEG